VIGIYKIENLINGKVYIGQSRNIEKRWVAHRTRPFNQNSNQYDIPLYRSIRKYGLENFSFVVLEETQIEDLDNREKYWIEYYGSHNIEKGYNLTDGGNSAAFTILTHKQVDEIKLLLETNMSQQDIANKYNVDQRSISYINTGATWIDQDRTYPIRSFSILASNEKYYCQNCGKEITTKGATLCVDCCRASRRKVDRASRDELKYLIRTTSFLQIGKIYGVSDTTIRKWCKLYRVPYKQKEIKSYSDEEWDRI
jgi:group I intron endonuclease